MEAVSVSSLLTLSGTQTEGGGNSHGEWRFFVCFSKKTKKTIMINGHNQLSFVFLSRTKYQTGFNRVAFCRSFGRSAEPRVQRLLGLRGSWWACEASAQLSVEGPSVWPAAPVRSTGHNRLNSPQAVHLYFAIYDRVQRVFHFFPPLSFPNCEANC